MYLPIGYFVGLLSSASSLFGAESLQGSWPELLSELCPHIRSWIVKNLFLKLLFNIWTKYLSLEQVTVLGMLSFFRDILNYLLIYH